MLKSVVVNAMKVKDLIKELEQCNPEADIINWECRNFNKEDYWPITLDGLLIDHEKKCFPPLKQKEASLQDANVIIIH